LGGLLLAIQNKGIENWCYSGRIKDTHRKLAPGIIYPKLPEQIDPQRLVDRRELAVDEHPSSGAGIENVGTTGTQFYGVGRVRVDWLVNSVHALPRYPFFNS